MKKLIVSTLCALALATAAAAAPLKLKPANPQPSSVKSGLAVKYAYPDDVKTLAEAQRALKNAKRGTPLKGMDHWDTQEGDKTLTSKQPFHVVAGISGYVKFDAPGTYAIDFLSNDGLEAHIGGKRVARIDSRTPCESGGTVQVSVPSAGWYDFKATYFQRLGTACLHMRRGASSGSLDWMPDTAFGH